VQFDLKHRPLWHPRTVEGCLDIPRVELDAMVESGKLPWVWDFGNGGVRTEIRILGHSVVEHKTGPIPEIGATKHLGLPEILKLVLPENRKTLNSVELQRLFHLGSAVIRSLVTAGEIKVIYNKDAGPGPNGCQRFTCESVAKLLGKRRVL
jgi:hypothetical protein